MAVPKRKTSKSRRNKRRSHHRISSINIIEDQQIIANNLFQAKKTGAFIVPVAVHSTQNWEFINWDTFYIEKPFGTIFMEYGSPIFFEKNMDFDQCEQDFIKGMNNIEHSNLEYANKQNI